ncbi:T9SS sorting signal type C domain-containing protein [Flavobacterium sp. Sd200]|uniref:GEVED domain-containing protein n=1 Tax=Flavobacterium sp. Sd200 TaxID=2692211 RepID=UPI0013681009|nr:GEVED domain-containing protein [Flavobacterium sp. Sd200]MXN92457.1 T9SS sorting signal type C domain-containing protein [Flavobacterium sp. Sd200]
MKKNYNLSLKRSLSFLRPPEGNSWAIDFPDVLKMSCMLFTTIMCLFTTTKTFAQDGDTCETAINLATLTSPYSSTTVGANDDYSILCANGNTSPDLFFYIEVPNGYTLVIGQTENGYDSENYVGYGTACPGQNQIACYDDPDVQNVTWENTTGSTQTVYWVQDGWNTAANEGTFTLAWTLTAPPPCNIPRSVTAAFTTLTSANISWEVPVTGTPTGYEYALTTSPTPPESGTTTTALSVTGVATTANAYNYVHVRTNCGPDGYSEWVTYRFYSGHCIPNSLYTGYNILSFITTVGFSNIANTTAQTAFYANNYDGMTVSQASGGSFDFSAVVPGYTGIDIWVDWNNDLDFDDEGEHVIDNNNYGFANTTYTGTINVPQGIALGSYRMRVRSHYYYYADNGPCMEYTYGAAQDYRILITTPPSCYTPINLLGVGVASGVANLSWAAQDLGTTPVGYEYFVSTSTTSPESGTPTTETSIEGYTPIVDNEWYYLHVRANCGSGSYSEWVVSQPFRYLQGDTCESAIDLATLTSPYSYTTVGATADYSIACANGNTAPDLFYYIEVPHGYTLTIGQTDNDYDSETYVAYGGACPGETVIACYDDPDIQTHVWENTTGSTQTVYWVQDGWNTEANVGNFTLEWSLIAPPACNIPRDVVGTMTSLTTADISWAVPNTGTPTGYEYAVTSSETPPATGTATTELSASGVTTVANAYNYVHVRTNCGPDGYSEWVTYRFYSGHCIPNSNWTGYNIQSFSTTVGFSNISNTTAQTAFYTNNYDSMTVSQEPGGSFTYSVAVPGWTNLEIWVDWNNDLDFDDEGELMASHTAYGFGNTVYTGNLTIPGATAEGDYRMRVRSRYYYYAASPCNVYEYGAAQDYKLSVTAPPSCYTPINLLGVAVASGTANLSWESQALGTTPVGYEYFVSTSTTSPESGTPITGTSVEGYTPITDNTWYYLHVRVNCGDGDYSQWAISAPFRYLQGDTCDSAIDLATLTSPYTYSTVGASNDTNLPCNTNTAPDLFYYIEVPNGYTLTIGQTTNNYDSTNYIGYGGACPGETSIACWDDVDEQTHSWENLTGSTQIVHWVQDGFGTSTGGSFTLEWTLIPPVTCDVPRELDVNLTSLTSADISWIVPNTGSPVGYEYAITTSATAPASGTYTTGLSATGVEVTPNVASYLHVRSICSEEDGNSVWVTYEFFSGYCPAGNTNATNRYISSVTSTLGETNFASTSTFTAGGYADYTSEYAVSTYAGGSFALTATHPSGTYAYCVWIDWNGNFDFTDAGERPIATQYVNSPAELGTITVPLGTPVGTYRMRIRNSFNTAPIPVCGNLGDGETEDYIINVVETPTCFAPYGVEILPQDETIANLSWGAPMLGNPPTGYEYVLSSSATLPTEPGTITSSTYIFDVPFNPATDTYLFVRSICGENEYSNWASNVVMGNGNNEFNANNVMVYQEGKSISITAGTTLIKDVTVFDIRGRKLYSEKDINATQADISNLQVQQQVLILEINTEKGKVSKRIVY